MAECC